MIEYLIKFFITESESIFQLLAIFKVLVIFVHVGSTTTEIISLEIDWISEKRVFLIDCFKKLHP